MHSQTSNEPVTMPWRVSPRGVKSNIKMIGLVNSVTSAHDIHVLIDESLEKHSAENKSSKAKDWLSHGRSKSHHYDNIMDVLIEHHSEYAALAWGAMKILLIAGVRHLISQVYCRK